MSKTIYGVGFTTGRKFPEYKNHIQEGCIKIPLPDGKEISFSFDNSLGAMDLLGRVEMCVFESETSSRQLEPYVYNPTAEELYEVLKKYLNK